LQYDNYVTARPGTLFRTYGIAISDSDVLVQDSTVLPSWLDYRDFDPPATLFFRARSNKVPYKKLFSSGVKAVCGDVQFLTKTPKLPPAERPNLLDVPVLVN
jgi:hypothetical protein